MKLSTFRIMAYNRRNAPSKEYEVTNALGRMMQDIANMTDARDEEIATLGTQGTLHYRQRVLECLMDVCRHLMASANVWKMPMRMGDEYWDGTLMSVNDVSRRTIEDIISRLWVHSAAALSYAVECAQKVTPLHVPALETALLQVMADCMRIAAKYTMTLSEVADKYYKDTSN